MPAERPDFYTVREFAARLRVHPRTIYRLIWADELDVVRVGGQIRIPAEVLERLQTSGHAPTTAA